MRAPALLVLGIGALLLAGRRPMPVLSPVEGVEGAVAPESEIPVPPAPLFDFSDLVSFLNQDQASADEASLNLDDFLYAIRSAEHDWPRIADEDTYGVFYGGSSFTDFSDHPVNTGEKKGIPLPAAMCVAAGFKDGVCVSTAAGAYQLTRPTWNEMRQAGSWGPYLPDFSPANQDEAARRILIRIKALPLVIAGDWPAAIARASTRWASLPGSTAQQGGRTLAWVMERINDSASTGYA